MPICRSGEARSSAATHRRPGQADRRLADRRHRLPGEPLLDAADRQLIRPANPIEIYGYKYPIEDCTSGACFPGYLWWNGYIPANRINSMDAQGRPNGIMGVPANYKPAATPLIP